MAFRSKRFVDTNASIPLNRLATPTQISSYIKRIINASQYDYHETEAFEVDKVIMNETQNHGAVLGNFINNPKQEIKGGVVLPLMPNVSMIPLKGEHVVVVEYNGQHYYTGIINRTNSVNENALPGTSDTYKQNTKYGNTFERKVNDHGNQFDSVYSQGSISFTLDDLLEKTNTIPNYIKIDIDGN